MEMASFCFFFRSKRCSEQQDNMQLNPKVFAPKKTKKKDKLVLAYP
jgi:hypothetical protein